MFEEIASGVESAGLAETIVKGLPKAMQKKPAKGGRSARASEAAAAFSGPHSPFGCSAAQAHRSRRPR